MKKMLFTLAMVMLTSTTMVAHNDHKEGRRLEHRKMDKTEMVKHRTDAIVKKYGLDDKQAKQLLELNTEQQAQMEKIRKQQEDLKKSHEAELKKIMTDEQYKNYQADKGHRHGGHKDGKHQGKKHHGKKHRGGPHRGGPNWDGPNIQKD